MSMKPFDSSTTVLSTCVPEQPPSPCFHPAAVSEVESVSEDFMTTQYPDAPVTCSVAAQEEMPMHVSRRLFIAEALRLPRPSA
ncbi:hypothetical protein EYF80_026422 [Liparis tanakae]|uniref:Uncharacterized protein n=1 Tax=Liparis tanakae TaxID=230148 RepID=A0A4Z2HCU6_9TELE|nr:hypothetical protein EYF80_026422 [Liparis tanakae]